MQLTASFLQAIADYRELLEKGYPQKAVHKLVGDRYSLSGTERSVLFRGFTTRDQCLSRISKQAEPCHVTRNELIVDAQLRSSNEIAALLAEKTTGSAFGVEVIISGSADKTLVDSDGLVATSDSAIIDRFHGKIFDLARFVLDHHFHPDFPRLGT